MTDGRAKLVTVISQYVINDRYKKVAFPSSCEICFRSSRPIDGVPC